MPSSNVQDKTKPRMLQPITTTEKERALPRKLGNPFTVLGDVGQYSAQTQEVFNTFSRRIVWGGM